MNNTKPANLRLAHEELDPGVENHAALDLARAYEPNAMVVSWDAQVRAERFFNAHGLYETLKEIERLEQEQR